jgi:esterase
MTDTNPGVILNMQLHFKESGQGGVVILLHGLFGSSDNWHFIAQRLAEKFHVFAVDHRNHGLSPHSAEMNYPLMAADVEKFFAARGLESASVVGHSMGGKTAMQFALQFPQCVEKLVVADMAPREYARRTTKFSPRCWRWTCRRSRRASRLKMRSRRKFPIWFCAGSC